MTRNRVWVVEMFDRERKTPKWLPCCDASLTKQEGIKAVREWREHIPDDKFRLVEYQSVRAK